MFGPFGCTTTARRRTVVGDGKWRVGIGKTVVGIADIVVTTITVII